MSYEKTWSAFALNQTPLDQSTASLRLRSFFYQLKEFLKNSAGWTVEASCTGSANGASDLWTGPASIAVAAEGSGHGWVILKSPSGIMAGANGSYTGDQSRVWLVLSANNTSPGFGRASLHLVLPTGGTNTATPTSANQILFDSQQFTTGLNGYFHFGSASTGHFYALYSQAGQGFHSAAMIFPPMGAVSVINATGLDFPYASPFICSFSAATPGALAMTALVPSAGVQSWNADGTCISKACRIVTLGNGAGGWIGANLPSAGDSINSRQLHGPLHVISEAAGKSAYLGRIADFFGSGAPTPQGSVDNVATPTVQYVSNIWVPVNSVMSI